MKEDKATMRADARRNYDRLITAARSLFLAEDVVASLDVIAKKAGVGIGTLYRHFPTRFELIRAVYGERIDELIQEVLVLSGKLTPDEALSQWLKDIMKYSEKYHGFSDLLIHASIDTESPLGKTSAQLLQRAQEKGHIRQDVTAEDVLRLIHGITMHTTGSVEALKLLEIILDGLKAPVRESG